jgi:hypothetical protein
LDSEEVQSATTNINEWKLVSGQRYVDEVLQEHFLTGTEPFPITENYSAKLKDLVRGCLRWDMEDRFDIADLRSEIVREIGKRTSRRTSQESLRDTGMESEELLVNCAGEGRAFEIGSVYTGTKRRRAEEG